MFDLEIVIMIGDVQLEVRAAGIPVRVFQVGDCLHDVFGVALVVEFDLLLHDAQSLLGGRGGEGCCCFTSYTVIGDCHAYTSRLGFNLNEDVSAAWLVAQTMLYGILAVGVQHHVGYLYRGIRFLIDVDVVG